MSYAAVLCANVRDPLSRISWKGASGDGFLFVLVYPIRNSYADDITELNGSYNLMFNDNQNYPDKTFFTQPNKRSLIVNNFKETIRQYIKIRI